MGYVSSLIFGIGGMRFSAGQFQLHGIGLAGILGVVLNLVLPQKPGIAVQFISTDRFKRPWNSFSRAFCIQ